LGRVGEIVIMAPKSTFGHFPRLGTPFYKYIYIYIYIYVSGVPDDWTLDHPEPSWAGPFVPSRRGIDILRRGNPHFYKYARKVDEKVTLKSKSGKRTPWHLLLSLFRPQWTIIGLAWVQRDPFPGRNQENHFSLWKWAKKVAKIDPF